MGMTGKDIPQQNIEWLISDGRGGYSFGPASDCPDKPEHALLSAVIRPPLRRQQCLRDILVEMRTNEGWTPIPGPLLRTRFAVLHGLPAFSCQTPAGVLNKFIWIDQKTGTLCFRLHNNSNSQEMLLRLRPALIVEPGFADDANWMRRCRLMPTGFDFMLESNSANALSIRVEGGCEQMYINQWAKFAASDPEVEMPDDYVPVSLGIRLLPQQAVTLSASVSGNDVEIAEHNFEQMVAARRQRKADLAAQNGDDRLLLKMLIASNDFLIERPTPGSLQGTTLLQGYPNLVDHGWHALQALPGILLTTGKHAQARDVLRLLREYEHKGRIPTQFSAGVEEPGYASADTGLWFILRVYDYWQSTQDLSFVEEMYSFMLKLVSSLMNGTDCGMQMDKDGLLANTLSSEARTWMDARVGEWQAIARTGKAIEVQGLWFNALKIMNLFSQKLNKDSGEARTRDLVTLVEKSILSKFWLPEGYLADVIADDNVDRSFRANQVIACGLPFSFLSSDQLASIAHFVSDVLLTPIGVSTLARNHPAWTAIAGQSELEEAAACYNGRVYPWLLPYYLNLASRTGTAVSTLREQFQALWNQVDQGIHGHIAESYLPVAPYSPGGAPASVAALGATIQSYRILQGQETPSPSATLI